MVDPIQAANDLMRHHKERMTHTDVIARLRAERTELVDCLGAFCNVAQDFIDGECRYGRVEEFIAECRALLTRIGGN